MDAGVDIEYLVDAQVLILKDDTFDFDCNP